MVRSISIRATEYDLEQDPHHEWVSYDELTPGEWVCCDISGNSGRKMDADKAEALWEKANVTSVAIPIEEVNFPTDAGVGEYIVFDRPANEGADWVCNELSSANGQTHPAELCEIAYLNEFVVNLTPHKVDIVRESGAVLSIRSSGKVARCAEQRTKIKSLYGVNVERAEYGEVTDLPEYSDFSRNIYIVSALVLNNTPDYRRGVDVFAPGKAIRNEDGIIIGCNGLSG